MSTPSGIIIARHLQSSLPKCSNAFIKRFCFSCFSPSCALQFFCSISLSREPLFRRRSLRRFKNLDNAWDRVFSWVGHYCLPNWNCLNTALLCKQPRGDSHFHGHVSPIICCNISKRQHLILWFFSLFGLSGFAYPPKVDSYAFFNVLGHVVSLLSHFSLEFQLKVL